MTLAPDRTRAPLRPQRLIQTRPIRHPDVHSPEFMNHRARWLVLMNILLPGSAQTLAGDRRLGRFGLVATLMAWALVIIAAAGVLMWRSAVISLLSHPAVLIGIQVLMIGYALLWLLLTLDTLRLARLHAVSGLHRVALPLVALLVVGLLGAGAAQAVSAIGAARGAIADIFFSSGPSLPASEGYYNVLLLGADLAEGRDSMRFDSISVASVNAETGAVTITGIPRDLGGFPFAEGPMRQLYPDRHSGHPDPDCGWGAGINQLRTEVEVCRDGEELYPNARALGSSPAIEATKDAAEGLLGIEIPYYVLIDMDGFVQLIDALGGVVIDVTERVPTHGDPAYQGQPVDQWALGWMDQGTQLMSGTTALWYATERYSSDDFARMQRQRKLQEAILAQFTPQNVLLRFNELAAAGSATVSTDLPRAKLPEFFDLMTKARALTVTRIELTPDNDISQESPDVAYIHQMIHSALHPPVTSPE